MEQVLAEVVPSMYTGLDRKNHAELKLESPVMSRDRH